MDPDLRNLRAFLAVAEELSFTRAARRLHLSQQGLTDRVRRLEDQLGAPLFTRTTRQVALTPLGRDLVAEVAALLRRVDDGWERIAARASRVPTRLRVGVSPALVFGVLPGLVERFAAEHPEIALDASEVTVPDIVRRVRAGELDAGVVLAPPSVPDLHTEVVHVGTADLMIAETHPLAARDAVGLHEVAKIPVLLTPREHSPGMYDAVIEACRAAGFTPEVLPLPRDRGYLPRAIFAGEAFALWSTLSPAEYVRRGLVTVPITGPRPRLEVALVRPPGEPGPGLGVLTTALRACVRDLEAVPAR